MRFNVLSLVVTCCVLTAGCDTAKVDELTKQVEQLQQESKRIQQELQAAQKERDQLRQRVAQFDEIRKGYEEARGKFQAQLAGLKAVLGAGVVNPLPPFEGLKNSDWIGHLMPGGAGELGNSKDLKEAGELLKSILGGQPNKP